MELQIEHCERLLAPLEFVWDEMDSLDQLLAKTVHLAGYDVLANGERALARTTLSWGPMKRTVHLDVTLLGIVAHRQIRYTIEASSLDSRLESSIDLIPLGPDETKLDYRAAVEVRHRLAAHLRGVVHEMTEEHAVGIIDRVKARSEKRRLAEERLLS